MPKPSTLPRITIYSKPDCHLCDIARERIDNVQKQYSFEIETIDITTSETLLEQYGERIPVVCINGEEAYVYRVSQKGLAKKLSALISRKSWLPSLKDRT